MPKPNTNQYAPVPESDVVVVLTATGDSFLVDRQHIDLVSRHCWHRDRYGYARAATRQGGTGKLRQLLLHRLLCATNTLKPSVDHINGDPSDCRSANLRACDQAENLRNTKRRVDNTTGVKGVGLHRQSGKYRARVKVGGVERYSALFGTLAEASAAVQQARASIHEEFARHE